MNTKQHIDALFSGYEETAALADFKEELQSNLDDRIKSLIKKGFEEKTAYEKAISELGDVSVLAEELSLKRRQEVFSEMYMNTRNYISPKRSALYALCGLVLGLAVLIPLITWFASGIHVGAVATLLPFGMVSILGFVFLGLTQETASLEAMNWKRVLWYVLSAGLILFGVLATFITYLGMEFASAADLAAHGADPENASILGAVSILMIFVLPGIALGIFLILTEKDRSKPWVKKRRQETAQREAERFGSPARQERFGLYCGALWIAAIAAFIQLTFTVGILYSWLVLVAALVGQMLLLAAFAKKAE